LGIHNYLEANYTQLQGGLLIIPWIRLDECWHCWQQSSLCIAILFFAYYNLTSKCGWDTFLSSICPIQRFKCGNFTLIGDAHEWSYEQAYIMLGNKWWVFIR